MNSLLFHDNLPAVAEHLWFLGTTNGGFTRYFDLGAKQGCFGYITHEPEPVGFVVSWPKSGRIIKLRDGRELCAQDIFDWLLWLKSHLPLPLCVGGWEDSDNHDFYLDVNTIVKTDAEAQELAVRWGQIAYYDLAGGKEIRV